MCKDQARECQICIQPNSSTLWSIYSQHIPSGNIKCNKKVRTSVTEFKAHKNLKATLDLSVGPLQGLTIQHNVPCQATNCYSDIPDNHIQHLQVEALKPLFQIAFVQLCESRHLAAPGQRGIHHQTQNNEENYTALLPFCDPCIPEGRTSLRKSLIQEFSTSKLLLRNNKPQFEHKQNLLLLDECLQYQPDFCQIYVP